MFKILLVKAELIIIAVMKVETVQVLTDAKTTMIVHLEEHALHGNGAKEQLDHVVILNLLAKEEQQTLAVMKVEIVQVLINVTQIMIANFIYVKIHYVLCHKRNVHHQLQIYVLVMEYVDTLITEVL